MTGKHERSDLAQSVVEAIDSMDQMIRNAMDVKKELEKFLNTVKKDKKDDAEEAGQG